MGNHCPFPNCKRSCVLNKTQNKPDSRFNYDIIRTFKNSIHNTKANTDHLHDMNDILNRINNILDNLQ